MTRRWPSRSSTSTSRTRCDRRARRRHRQADHRRTRHDPRALPSVGVRVGRSWRSTRSSQVNVTESRRGVIRGMHAEDMTKLLSVASGEAFGAYVDLRPSSSTYGVVARSICSRGSRCWYPPGSPTGSRRSPTRCQYVYCFDEEWRPDMPGQAVTPLDPELAIEWPVPVDPDDVTMVSAKDRTAPAFADLSDTSHTTHTTHTTQENVVKLFVTGAAGFIGSNYVRWVLANTDHEVTVFDKLTYAGNLASIEDVVDDRRCRFVHGDICDQDAVTEHLPGHDAVVHFAAESHVDRSIADPYAFVHTNVFGTNVLVRRRPPMPTVERSCTSRPTRPTASIEEGSFSETDMLTPRSPYSAAKAGSDLLALSYHTTYDLPVRRDPLLEQLRAVPVPREADPAVHDEPARRQDGAADGRRRQRARLDPRRGPQPRGASGAGAVGDVGEIYNIGAHNEITNRDITERLLELTGRDESAHRVGPRPARPRPPLLGRDRQDHRARLAARTRLRRRPRAHGRVVPDPPRLVGATRRHAPDSDARSLVTGAGGQLGRRPRRGLSTGRRRRDRGSIAPRSTSADRDAVFGS